jgi:hypothetical protein
LFKTFGSIVDARPLRSFAALTRPDYGYFMPTIAQSTDKPL